MRFNTICKNNLREKAVETLNKIHAGIHFQSKFENFLTAGYTEGFKPRTTIRGIV